MDTLLCGADTHVGSCPFPGEGRFWRVKEPFSKGCLGAVRRQRNLFLSQNEGGGRALQRPQRGRPARPPRAQAGGARPPRRGGRSTPAVGAGAREGEPGARAGAQGQARRGQGATPPQEPRRTPQSALKRKPEGSPPQNQKRAHTQNRGRARGAAAPNPRGLPQPPDPQPPGGDKPKAGARNEAPVPALALARAGSRSSGGRGDHLKGKGRFRPPEADKGGGVPQTVPALPGQLGAGGGLGYPHRSSKRTPGKGQRTLKGKRLYPGVFAQQNRDGSRSPPGEPRPAYAAPSVLVIIVP